MSIDWHALGTVFAVTLLTTVALVGVFTLGVVGLSQGPATRSPLLTRTAACLCFAACGAAVGYGIHLIIA